MLEIGVNYNCDKVAVIFSDYELEQFRKYLENGDHYIKLTWYELTPDAPSYLKSKPKTGYFRKDTILYFSEVNKEKYGL